MSFGDEDYPGTPRAKDKSCNIRPQTTARSKPRRTGRSPRSRCIRFMGVVGGDVASPGRVPEPTTLVLLLIGGAVLVRSRR
jgi:hypothetical protein